MTYLVLFFSHQDLSSLWFHTNFKTFFSSIFVLNMKNTILMGIVLKPIDGFGYCEHFNSINSSDP